MPELDNAQARKFSNEKSRTAANLVMAAFRTIDQYLLDITGPEWEANQAVIVARDDDVIVDGSAADGRKVVTKVSTAELKHVCVQIKAVADTSNYRALVNQWVTGGQPLF